MRSIVALKSVHPSQSHFALVLLMLLSGCTVPIATDPDRFNVGVTTLSPLRVKTIALNNAYQTATVGSRLAPSVPGGPRIRQTVDVKALTDTALSMMSRAMEKQGIAISPDARKTVTLAVTRVDLEDQYMRGAVATVMLEARFPDGTGVMRQATRSSALQYGRAIDAAVSSALADLLGDARFAAYLNAPDAVPPEPSIPAK